MELEKPLQNIIVIKIKAVMYTTGDRIYFV